MQLICCSATINYPLRSELKKYWKSPTILIKVGESFQIPSSIIHRYKVCKHESQKIPILLQILFSDNPSSTLIFISSKSSILKFVQNIQKQGFYSVIPLHTRMINENSEERQKFLQDFQNGKIKMVVATEEIARFFFLKNLMNSYFLEV